MEKDLEKFAAELHHNVPPDWYYRSIRRNLLQRYWHNRRFKEVTGLIEPVKGRVLDIGSADGVFSNLILKKSGAKEVIGIDVLASSVEWANGHWKRNKRLKFYVGDAHSLKFGRGHFDAVTALEVLEHILDPDKVIREIKRVLKKGGYGILLVPSDNLLFKLIWWFLTNFWWARIWDDCHIQSYDRQDSLAKRAERVGFEIEVDRKFLLGMLNVIKIRKK